MRVSLSRAQLISLSLLPSLEEDSVDEKAWLDIGWAETNETSNLLDGLAFEAAIGSASRGRCTRIGTLDSVPTNSPLDASFFLAAGREIISADYATAVSPKRQIMNQADIFYVSAHGYPDGGVYECAPSNIGGYWSNELHTVIFSACSALDINNYNDNPNHIHSPGKQWEQTGPTFFLGYNYTAPNDLQGSVPAIITWATNRIAYGNIDAWRIANGDSAGRSACAIRKNVGYYYYKKMGIWPAHWYTWTFVLKDDW